MSVQFGIWKLDGQPTAPDYTDKVSAVIAPFGPDSDESYAIGDIKILYRAFCTTKESRHEKQPHVASSGAVITWDGRLDNRSELIIELRASLTTDLTDVAIVAAAYEKWGDKCLPKLIGDWALSVWNPRTRSLLLAKDPIGSRHLYYSFDNNQIAWSTILDPLVLFAGKTFSICEEYIAGWFAANAAAHLTPYVGVHTVPPSSFVLLRPGKRGVSHTLSKFWEFDPSNKIRYRSDGEYAEHFRTLFSTAVRRRLRSDQPILAELSGGLDSSSIVCMADLLMSRGQAECPRVDTISWYDDSFDHLEPQSNELRWISKVEEKRGRTGCHINFRELKATQNGSPKKWWDAFDNDHFAATPSPRVADPSDQHFQRCLAYMKSQGHRVTFSGIGGGEFTGGFVPDPTTELQNLLTSAHFVRLVRQLNAWAAKMRKRRLPLLWTALRGFFSSVLLEDEMDMRSVPWFEKGFVRRNRAALRCYIPPRTKFFGPPPSFQDDFARVSMIRRLMSRNYLFPEMLREVRYPFLDRDLLEFLLAVPREQIVGVGKRRFLMKNAIAGLIPDELLNRRPKDFNPPPEPSNDTSAASPRWPELNQHLLTGFLGIVDPVRFLNTLQKVRRNEEAPSTALDQTLMLESWLRHLVAHKVLANPTPSEKQAFSPSLQPETLRAPAGPKSLAS